MIFPSSVSLGESVKSSIIINIDQALQGRAAGVTANYDIWCTGFSTNKSKSQSTINANAEPLVIDKLLFKVEVVGF